MRVPVLYSYDPRHDHLENLFAVRLVCGWKRLKPEWMQKERVPDWIWNSFSIWEKGFGQRVNWREWQVLRDISQPFWDAVWLTHAHASWFNTTVEPVTRYSNSRLSFCGSSSTYFPGLSCKGLHWSSSEFCTGLGHSFPSNYSSYHLQKWTWSWDYDFLKLLIELLHILALLHILVVAF